MSDPDDVRVLRALWERFQARDWDAAGALLAEDAILDWPHTGERIVGRAGIIELNRTYPEGWEIQIDRVWSPASGHAASLVRVPFRGEVEWAFSLWELKEGRLSRGVETWSPEQPSPAWRAHLVHKR